MQLRIFNQNNSNIVKNKSQKYSFNTKQMYKLMRKIDSSIMGKTAIDGELETQSFDFIDSVKKDENHLD